MNKRYWVRGGVIGLALVVFACLFLLYQFYSCVSYKPLYNYPVGGDNGSYLVPIPPYCVPPSYLWILILILGVIIIGALTGWLYGKIKNRDKS